jgi:hypothetical protein
MQSYVIVVSRNYGVYCLVAMFNIICSELKFWIFLFGCCVLYYSKYCWATVTGPYKGYGPTIASWKITEMN